MDGVFKDTKFQRKRKLIKVKKRWSGTMKWNSKKIEPILVKSSALPKRYQVLENTRRSPTGRKKLAPIKESSPKTRESPSLPSLARKAKDNQAQELTTGTPLKIKWFCWEPLELSKSKFLIYFFLILFPYSGDIKMSYMEGEALARKKDPGPQLYDTYSIFNPLIN